MNCKLIQFQSTSQNSKAIWRHSVLTIQRLMSHKLIQRSEIKETLHEIRIIVFSSSSLPFTVKKCLFLSHSSFLVKLKNSFYTQKKKEAFLSSDLYLFFLVLVQTQSFDLFCVCLNSEVKTMEPKQQDPVTLGLEHR